MTKAEIEAQLALSLLLQWIQKYLPESVCTEPHAADGIDKMVIPDDCQGLVREIRDGAAVCEALFMLTTADNELEAKGDCAHIREKLDAYWTTHSSAVIPPLFFHADLQP